MSHNGRTTPVPLDSYEPKMSESSSERDPLLQEPILNDGDEEATPNYPAKCRKRVLRDFFVVTILFVCIGIVVIFLAVKKPAQDSSLLHDIRKLYDTPSLAAAVLRNGSFDIQVTGVRKYDDPTLVTTDDFWHLGSTTKAMSTTILALLIEDGLLSWETTIAEALPAWRGKMQNEHMNTTLAMLGAHRSGLSDAWFSLTGAFYQGLYNFSTVEGRELITEFALTHPPDFAPGTQYVYCNAGYVLLGYIMEQVTGKSWEDLIFSRVLEPLGMDQCRVGISLDTSIPPTNPWPHRFNSLKEIIPIAPDVYGDFPIAIAPAGLLYCSLASYSKFLKFHLDGYKGRRATANVTLSEASFKKLHDPWPGHWYSSGGWGTRDIEGVGHVLWHPGSNTFNYLIAMIAPDVEGAFVAATNIGHESAVNATDEVIDALVDGRLLK